MKVRLGEAFDLQMGKTPSRNNTDYWGGENKWVSISDLSTCNKYIFETKECITDKAVLESGIKMIPKNTVLMSFKLSIGKVAITASELFTNEAIMAFIGKSNFQFNENYLYYLFNGMDWTEGSNKAVKGLTLNKATLSQKYINLPSLEIQAGVVEKLEKLFDLIHKRKQQLEKLDLLVKSKFIEMFGDRKINSKGWNCKPLREIIDFHNGKAHEQVVDENGRFILVTSKCIASDFSDFRKTNASLYPLHKGDIVMVMSDVPNGRALGKCQLITEEDKYTLNQRICAFDNYSYNSIFLLNLLNRHEYFLSFDNGNSQTNLRKDDILKCNLICPPITLQNEFASFVAQIDKSKFTIKQSLEKLETLKKALMQKYFG